MEVSAASMEVVAASTEAIPGPADGFFSRYRSTLVISTSVISNNCLSRREKSGPCFNTGNRKSGYKIL